MMKNTKCKHCIEGVVLSPDCERIVANRWCELEEWDEETHCAPGGCRYYARAAKEGVAE